MRKGVVAAFRPVSMATFVKDARLYAEYRPCPELAQAVQSYWVSPALGWDAALCGAATREEIIIPDGCMDIICEIDRETKEQHCFVVGTMSQAIRTVPDFTKQIYAIRFLPAGLYPLIRQSLRPFSNQMLELALVDKALEKELLSIFLAPRRISETCRALDRLLLRRLAKSTPNAVLLNALDSVVGARGLAAVSATARQQCVSERQLNRLFRERVGVSPKEFARIIRFQAAVRQMQSGEALDWAALALESGYHDQSHFINEFKTFTGSTPTQFL